MDSVLSVTLQSDTQAERRTRDAVSQLCTKYDLTPWLYTTTIVIDETAHPHSHPVLTINTFFEDDETMLLAELIHEQLHWFEETHADVRDRAVDELATLYVDLPKDRLDNAGDDWSTRLHLLLCWWEYQALKKLLGNDAGTRAIERLSRHHYRWIYATVLTDDAKISNLAHRYNLVPAAIRT